jgi:hypothetical protein
MAQMESVPPDETVVRRKVNTSRYILTVGSAVCLALIAVCFLASQGKDVGSLEANVETKMQQLHQLASQSKMRSHTFLRLQGKIVTSSLCVNRKAPA